MRKLFTISFSLLFSFNLFAQQPVSWTSADMYMAIRKLNVLGSVLYVAAHPDDENTRLISYFSKEKMYRTGYLSITRGDGGQNLIGDEQGIELGLIRTQELLAARRIDGGEQFFTRAFDFGFSKSPEETFSKWDKEKILSDVVWVIRKFQPDVIITRFPTTGEGGHGHHTASAILANEAFTAAADPGRFSEQLKYVKPWQAKRVLWNSFNFGNTNLTSPDQFKFDVGGYNPLLGKSYGEIAATSRSLHKSQGFGVAAARGETFEFFKTIGGSEPKNDLFEGVETSWNRVPGGERIASMIDRIASSFDFLHPEKSVKALVELYRGIKSLPDGNWKTQKLIEVQQLIEQCSGLWMDVFTQEQYAVQTDSIRFNFQFNNRLGVNTVLKTIVVDEFDSTLNQALVKNKNLSFPKTIYVPSTKPVTQPYWLENKMEEGYYNVNNQLMISQPDVQASYLVNITVNIEGEDFNFIKPVKYKHTDPVKGELYQPLVIVYPFLIRANPSTVIATSQNIPVYEIYLKSFKNGSKGKSRLFFENANSKQQVFDTGFAQPVKGKEISQEFTQNRALDFGNYILKFHQEGTSNHLYNQYMNTVKYEHIPSINYFKEAILTVKKIDVKTEGKNIGYIVGAGDKVPEALEQMGYIVNMLSLKELSKNTLDKFDAIITGVRAYNTMDWLGNYYDKIGRASCRE